MACTVRHAATLSALLTQSPTQNVHSYHFCVFMNIFVSGVCLSYRSHSVPIVKPPKDLLLMETRRMQGTRRMGPFRQGCTSCPRVCSYIVHSNNKITLSVQSGQSNNTVTMSVHTTTRAVKVKSSSRAVMTKTNTTRNKRISRYGNAW